MQRRCKEIFERLSGKDITEKQIMAASLILTADALIDMLIFEDGNGLKIDEMTQFLSTHGEVSSDTRAYEWLLDWLAQNNKKFEGKDDLPEVWGRLRWGRFPSFATSLIKPAPITDLTHHPFSPG